MTEAEKFCKENNVKFRLSNIGENIGVVALEYINMLEKENEELKKDKEWLDNTNNKQTVVILTLQAKIEKMRCCHNCKNFINKSYCITPCNEHNKWELAE